MIPPEQVAAMVADANRRTCSRTCDSYMLAPHVRALAAEVERVRKESEHWEAATKECRNHLQSFNETIAQRDEARADLKRACELLDVATEYEQCNCRGECGRTAHAFLAEQEGKQR